MTSLIHFSRIHGPYLNFLIDNDIQYPYVRTNHGKEADDPMQLKIITSVELMKGQREIIIVHDRDEYRLRITSNNKMILTK